MSDDSKEGFQQISPSRVLVRNGELAIVQNGNGAAHNMMLFNDILMWNGPTTGARYLDILRVIDTTCDTNFSMVSSTQTKVGVQAKDAGAKTNWMSSIISARSLEGTPASTIASMNALPEIDMDLAAEKKSAGVQDEEKIDPVNVSWGDAPSTPGPTELRAVIFNTLKDEIKASIAQTTADFEAYREKDPTNVVLEVLADALKQMNGTMDKTFYRETATMEESNTEEAIEDAWQEVTRISGKMRDSMTKLTATSKGKNPKRVSKRMAALRAKFEADSAVLSDSSKRVRHSGKKISSSADFMSDDPAANIENEAARNFWIKRFGAKLPIVDFKDLKEAYEEEFNMEMSKEMVNGLLDQFGLQGPLSPYKEYPIHAKNFGTITNGLGFPFDLSKTVKKGTKKGALLEAARMAEFEQIVSVGDKQFVKEFVNKGLNHKLLAKRFEKDNTVLHVAAKRGDVELFKFFEDKMGQNKKMPTVNDINEDGLGPVHYAGIHGHDELTSYLEKRTNPKLLEDRPILHECVRHNKPGSVRSLINKWENMGQQDNINTRDKWGRTALGVAAQNSNQRMANTLIKHGAKPSPQDIKHAVDGDNPQVMQLLMSKSEDDSDFLKKETEEPLLNYAAGFGTPAVCSVICGNGATLHDKAAVSGETAFLSAAKNGNIGVVHHCVTVDSTVISQTDAQGRNALHLSCGEIDSEMTAILLDKGADPNQPDNEGYTPMMTAASMGETELCDLMISKGNSDVNALNNNKESSLCIAARKGDFELCRALIKNGADPNHPASKPPIVTAAKHGNVKMLRLLFEAGANPNATSGKTGRTGLHQAALKKNVECMKEFFENGADLNMKDKDGNTALHLAISVGHIEGVRALIEAGADLDVQNKDGITPIQYAIIHKRNDILDLLLTREEKSLGLKKKDKHGERPIHTAIIHNNVYALERLMKIKGQSTLQAGTKKKSTPLTLAAEKGRLDCVKAILAQKVEVDHQDSRGKTALAYASQGGHVEIAKLLIGEGADLSIKDKKGVTPLIVCADKGNDKMVDVLIEPMMKQGKLDEKSADGRTALYAAAWSGHQLILSRLLDKGADPAIASDKGWTPLHAAAYKKRGTCVTELIERKVDVDVANFEGITPLCNAAQAGDIDVVMELHKAGAKLEPGEESWTPLQISVLHNRADVAVYLLDEGADVMCENKEKSSAALYMISKPVYDKIYKHPLVVAMWEKHPELVKGYNRIARWIAALGRINLMKYFVECGGNITKEHMELAAEYNKPEMVGFLSEKFGWEKAVIDEDESKEIFSAVTPEKPPKPEASGLRALTRMVSAAPGGDVPEGL